MAFAYVSGSKVRYSRKVLYNATYNQLRRNLNDNPTDSVFNYSSAQDQSDFICNCVTQELVNSTAPNPGLNISNAQRVSQILNSSSKTGGKVQYVSNYSRTPIFINYLGRTPGQPGGGGAPPKNVLN